MPARFITATGTEIGKTLVTAALLYQCRIHRRQVMALKPVISGMQDGWAGSDTDILAQAMGRGSSAAVLNTISPFAFKAPLSPAMAARAEGRTLDLDAVISASIECINSFDYALIEGVGGSFVPMDDTHLVADWIKALNMPSVLVAGSYLGTQSHTIATVEAMRARGLEISDIVISESAPDTALYDNHPDVQQTMADITRHTDIPCTLLPRLASPRPWENAPALMHLFGVPAEAG